MSSVTRSLSQVDGLKRLVVAPGETGGLIYDINGANGQSVAADAVLRDMGKTVVLANGTLLRKVQVIPVGGSTSSTPYEYVTGYMYLDNVPGGQNIVALN